MSQIDDAFFFAEPLTPNDRLRLMARLWSSLPPDHWAAPSAAELADLDRRLAELNAGHVAQVPWEIVDRMLVQHEVAKKGRIYSAPRRFDLATLLIVTVAYSLILGGLSIFRLPPIVSGYVFAFVTLVGIGQAMLFGGKWPRFASVISGIAAFFAMSVLSIPYLVGHYDIGGPSEAIAFSIVASVFVGSLLGYLAGVLVGGVFLVAEIVRHETGPELEHEQHTSPASSTPINTLPSAHPIANSSGIDETPVHSSEIP